MCDAKGTQEQSHLLEEMSEPIYLSQHKIYIQKTIKAADTENNQLNPQNYRILAS